MKNISNQVRELLLVEKSNSLKKIIGNMTAKQHFLLINAPIFFGLFSYLNFLDLF